MDGARRWAGSSLKTTALLGGSFNPAHRGHRRISLWAAEALGVDEVWWLVSPGNPLKAAEGMAPLPVRLRSARAMARRSIIRPTAIERELGTRYTIDTLRALVRRYPRRRFIWLMGGDNLTQFHRWKDWRKVAALMPIAVIARPHYMRSAQARRALGWLGRFVRPSSCSKHWAQWRPPALLLLRFRPDPSSATAIRRAHPDWSHAYPSTPVRDAVSRRMIEV